MRQLSVFSSNVPVAWWCSSMSSDAITAIESAIDSMIIALILVLLYLASCVYSTVILIGVGREKRPNHSH